MTIAHEFAAISASLEASFRLITAEEIIAAMDYTLLNEQATAEQLAYFIAQAKQHPVAAVCLYPQHLQEMPLLAEVKRATVVNFPTGLQTAEEVLAAIAFADDHCNAQEIDYVFPYSLYLNGAQKEALVHCRQVSQYCQQRKLVLKVIVETGAFTCSETLYHACCAILHQGCDFLKTSTGKISTGATTLAAFTLLKAIATSAVPCGLKVSGGIKTLEDARLYSNLAEMCQGRPINKAWFRIGTSRLK